MAKKVTKKTSKRAVSPAKSTAAKAGKAPPEIAPSGTGSIDLDDGQVGTITAPPSSGDDLLDGLEGEEGSNVVSSEIEAKPEPKGGKAKADPAPEPTEKPEEFDYAEGFEIVAVPVDKLKPSKSRELDEDKVISLAKSIKNNGLQNPIVIGTDKRIINGDYRLAAFIKLGRKTIPARIASTAKGDERIASSDRAAHFQMLAENINRTDFSEITKARLFKRAIDDKLVDSPKELAAQLGISSSVVSRSLSVLEKGSKAIQTALEEEKIGIHAASAIIARTDSPQEQAALLTNLLAASEGKVTKAAVEAKAPAKSPKKAGRKPSRTIIAGEALKSDETGISGVVMKNVDKSFEVILSISIPSDADTFIRFDLAKKVQQRIAKLDMGEVRTELEIARKRIA